MVKCLVENKLSLLTDTWGLTWTELLDIAENAIIDHIIGIPTMNKQFKYGSVNYQNYQLTSSLDVAAKQPV